MSTFQMIEHMANTNLSNRIQFPSSDERKSMARFAESLSMVRYEAARAIPNRVQILIKGGAR